MIRPSPVRAHSVTAWDGEQGISSPLGIGELNFESISVVGHHAGKGTHCVPLYVDPPGYGTQLRRMCLGRAWPAISIMLPISKVGRVKAEHCPTSFPEAHNIGQCGMARPIRRIRPVLHEAALEWGQSATRVTRPCLDRVVMEVVAVALEIPSIADRAFPEPALPDAPFAFLWPSIRQSFPRRHGPGKRCLDQPPSRGVVRIVRRQGPQEMKMIG